LRDGRRSHARIAQHIGPQRRERRSGERRDPRRKAERPGIECGLRPPIVAPTRSSNQIASGHASCRSRDGAIRALAATATSAGNTNTLRYSSA
jgi:hypothetical protein